jgi:hypothetical protein
MTLRTTILSTFNISVLSLQSLSFLVEARTARRKAKKMFHQTLISEGIDRQDARELAEAYPDPVKEVLGVLRTLRRDSDSS